MSGFPLDSSAIFKNYERKSLIMGNTYSVPSRLIGTRVLVRVRTETLEGYVGTRQTFTLPRLLGKQQHHIDYHHLIWSEVAQTWGLRRLPLPR